MLVRCNSARLNRPPAAARHGMMALWAAVALAGLATCGDASRGQPPELPAAADPLPAPSAEHDADAGEPLGSPEPSTPPAPVADDGPKPALANALERPGDVTFRNMTIEAALFTLGEQWKVNIVTGKQIEGDVNGVFKQAPLREILDAILLANGYSYRPIGESLVIQPTAEVGSANPLFRSLTIPIQYGSVDEIVSGAELLKSAGGQIKSFPTARSILVVDYADRVETISAFVRGMEAAAAQAAGVAAVEAPSRLEVAYFHTHFIPATSAQQPLLTVLSPLGRVAVMPRENRLLVVDYAANLEMVGKVLERIDRPRPQVRITALIYDLSLEDVEQLGINWGSAGKGNTVGADGEANQALEFETTTLTPFTAGEAGGQMTVRSLTRNFDINTVLLLLQTANDARLLANPTVTVMDNELAEWKSVSEIPYQQITQSELGGQIGTTAFKEAGITLKVQPTIAGDGTIEMMVEPEFSRLAGFTPQEDQPIIDTRKATTKVRIANRQTLVLSGLRQRSDTGEFNGIPFLKDVKYVGSLFRSRNTNVRESELVVFIMPELVSYDEPQQPREFQALETINCRLEAIPYAEGCPAPGMPVVCAAPPEALPPVEGDMPVDEDLPAPESTPPAPSAGPMRPPYEQRFRADNKTSLRPKPAADGNQSEKKPSMWKRLFSS
ncbi:MAG: hypothetical protein DCC67_01455 [Planctomycetota bacterium]|nr:MAG: hypothetical protein DCC67_01455 [Planctomycetota bacterium]